MSTTVTGGTASKMVPRAATSPHAPLSQRQLLGALDEAFPDAARGQRVLVLVPDTTRDVPMASLLPLVLRALAGAKSIDVMVALGTHPPMPAKAARDWLGLERDTGPGPEPVLHNHAWADPGALASIGSVSEARLAEIAGPYWHESLGGDLTIKVNRAALRADRVVIVGPTLPHEVAGFSGGAKYLFPGISGPEMIDVMHWLGALAGVLATIGVEGTPVRALIDEAAALLPTPVSLVAVVTGQAELDEARPSQAVVNGIYAGDVSPAWSASVDHARRLHTHWLQKPYSKVISCAMPIYDELWTAGKAMYKLEPAVADGGELVIYAPHLSEVSLTHGHDIFEVGYHVLPYFLGQWERFCDRSLAVLAHSTHVKGAGRFDPASNQEEPRVRVTLATAISADDCARLNLGYQDVASVTGQLSRPDDSTLVVPRAGEMLYRVR